MKNKFRILLIMAIFLIFIFPTINLDLVDAVSPASPYIKIHCDVNITYIENNLCVSDNCSPIVEEGYGTNRFRVNNLYFDVNSEGLTINPLFSHFRDNEANITNETINFLKNVCEPDITPVLLYLKENNVPDWYVEFYPYKPFGDNIKKIDSNWYFTQSSFDHPWDQPDYFLGFIFCFILTPLTLLTFLFFSIFQLIIFAILLFFFAVILILHYLSCSKKINFDSFYVIPIFFGFIGGIITAIIRYKKEKNKKKAIMLIIIGLIVSIILFIIGTYYFYIFRT